MEFRVLGPLEVVGDGESLALGSPKQRALLAVLVMSANQVVAVDRLVEELWGDEAPARAMASLQAYVSRLRRLLQPSEATRGRSNVLVTQPPGYVLRVDVGSIDAVRFEHQTAEGIRSLAAGDAAGALNALEEALRLWRGPPYADFSFEQFAHAEITRLNELRLSAIEARLAALVEAGHPAAAVADAEAVVRDHPLREGAWASLMTGLYHSGRQGEALRAYQRARRVIGEELGIEPGPALQELEAKVLHQSLPLQASSGSAAAVVRGTSEAFSPPMAPAAAGSPTHDPLVGRDQELQRLAQAVTGALGGMGRAVVLHGEPGIGKTRLAREVARQAAQAGAVVGQGGCVEGGVAAAYWPWMQALRQLLESFQHLELPVPLGEALAELAQLDPTLRRWAADIPAPVPLADPELARARLQRAGVDVLVGLARLRPVTIVIEDLHWSGQPSLQLLSLLGPELASAPLVVVVTYRDEEIGPALGATLAGLERVADTVDVRLDGLDDASVLRFVELISEQEVSPSLAAGIAERTGGNPLFVAELTRLLRSEGSLREDAVGFAPVPTGVREVIRRRLERLPPQTTTVLTVAAVIGRRFELGLLARLVELSEDELLDRVETAVAIGVVSEGDAPIGTFVFTHDLVRDTLQAALGGTRRARLHARVAQALLDRGDEGDPSRPFALSYHLVHALPFVSAEEVARHVLAAADAAVTRLAFEQAQEQLRRALALVEALPPEARAAHELAVRIRLARVLTHTGGYAFPEVRQHTQRGMELAAVVEPRPEVTHALYAAGVSAGVQADFATALAIGRRLLTWGEEHGDPTTLCLGHSLFGGFSWNVGNVDTSARHLSLAVEVVDTEKLDLRSFYDGTLASGVSVRATHAHVAWMAGRDEEASALIADAIRRAERLGHEIAIVFALCFDAWLAVYRRDRGHARRRAREVIVRADALGYRQFCVMGRILAASAHDDPTVRAAELQDAVAGWEATGARIFQVFFLALRAEAELDLGGCEAASALLAGARHAARTTGERFYEPEVYRLLGDVALKQGRIDEAALHYQRGWDVACELGLIAQGERVAASFEALRTDLHDWR